MSLLWCWQGLNFRKCYADPTGRLSEILECRNCAIFSFKKWRQSAALFSLLDTEEISNERYGLTSQKAWNL